VKVLVRPVYGFGWYTASNPPVLDVPREFLVDLEVVEPGSPFRTAIGFVAEQDHLLTGLWIVLQQRTHSDEPSYNLLAYNGKPRLDSAQKPTLTGAAIVVPISN
jgi:hypothetical protein